MLELREIETAFPEYLRGFKRNILREYLQYKILEIIYATPFRDQLRFIGGTALRIVHDLPRFSEDLDFDSHDLDRDAFEVLSQIVARELEQLGYQVSISFSGRVAFRCNIRFPELLYQQGLSPIRQEKILIQLDTQDQGVAFEPSTAFINKFDVFAPIVAAPIDILLAQKIYAAFNRKRPKGRDFFDIIFLLGKTGPNFDFLAQKIGVKTLSDLKIYMREEASKLDFDQLVGDLRPFVFRPSEADKVLLFEQYIDHLR